MEALNLAVLIPIWREESKNVLEQNIKVFSGLKYPPKTKVFWLLHETDDQTSRKVDYIPFEVLLDDGYPPLKAKALNNAAAKINAQVLAVFDVDAIPEQDYLTRAYKDLLHAHKEDPNVICLQGERYPYHAKPTWLAPLDEKEYFWVRQGKVYCHGSGFLIFREALLKLGGYPETVTEDKALNQKIFAKNYVVHRFFGKFYEETPSTLREWIGQRVRWHKGENSYLNLHKAFQQTNHKLHCLSAILMILRPSPFTISFFVATGLLALIRAIGDHIHRDGIKAFYIQRFRDYITIYICLRAELEKKLAPHRWFHTPKYGRQEKE